MAWLIQLSGFDVPCTSVVTDTRYRSALQNAGLGLVVMLELIYFYEHALHSTL